MRHMRGLEYWAHNPTIDELFFSRYLLESNAFPDVTRRKKEELVEALYQCPAKAMGKLQLWRKTDIVELLCVELGKRKVNSQLSKSKVMELLIIAVTKKVAMRRSRVGMEAALNPSPPQPNPMPLPPLNIPPACRGKRKIHHHPRSPFVAVGSNSSFAYCSNLACRAVLQPNESFCKRCSCCICHKFDENKDPSFWLVCGSETPQGKGCGMSCHLECAFCDERAGILKIGNCVWLDGSYYCTSCGRVNDLFSCWRKLLMKAKDARKVGDLGRRLLLSHKILSSTDKFQRLHQPVDEAKKMLEAEFGPLNFLPEVRARTNANRFPAGIEAQKLCAHAISLLDLAVAEESLELQVVIANAVTPEGAMMSGLPDETKQEEPMKRTLVDDLNELPKIGRDEDGSLQVEQTGTPVDAGVPMEVEQNAIVPLEIPVALVNGQAAVSHSTSTPSVAPPSSSEARKASFNEKGEERSGPGSIETGSLLVGSGGRGEEGMSSVYPDCLNKIRQLETMGLLDRGFRLKFITWLSLRATTEMRCIIKVFIDAFSDDPKGLAEQIIDTFSGEILKT